MEKLAVLLVLIAITCAFLLLRSGKNGPKHRLPPSPLGIPVLGHLHLLGRNLHTSLMELSKKHGEFMFLQLGVLKILVVSSPESAREALQTQDLSFSSRPLDTAATIYFGYNGLDLVWAPYGEYWRGLRKLCTLDLLTSKQVELSAPSRKIEVSALIAELSGLSRGKASVDLSQRLRSLSFNAMARTVLGKSYSAKDGGGDAADRQEREEALRFKDAFEEIVRLTGSVNVAEMLPWLKWLELSKHRTLQSLHRTLDDFIEKQIQEHKRSWRSDQAPRDFIDSMLPLASQGLLSDTAMKGVALDAIVGGSDTSSVTVEWAMSELVRSPDLMRKAQRELDQVTGRTRRIDEADLANLPYLQAIVKETFRLHPAAPLLLPRESPEACTVAQYAIPARTRLLVNAYAIGRDPLAWDDPLKFDPERFMTAEGRTIDARGRHFQLLPFGSGRRGCPGVLLGTTTVQYVLGSLLSEFEWELPDGARAQDLDMSEEFGLTLPRASPLVLVPSLRSDN